jgi:hypothetical protein
MVGAMGGNLSRSIAQLPGDEDAALAAHLHARKALVEAGNCAANPLRKAHGLRRSLHGLAIGAELRLSVFVKNRRAGMVVGRVELLPVVGTAVQAKPAGVEELVQLIGLGHRAVANLDLLVAQRKGGILGRFNCWNSRSWNPEWELASGSSALGNRNCGLDCIFGCRIGSLNGCLGGSGCRLGRGLCACGGNASGHHENQNSLFHGVV